MALAVDRVINIEVLCAANEAIAIDHHEVATTTAPSNPCTDWPPSVDLIAHLLETRLPDDAYEVVGTHQRPIKVPRNVTRRWDRTIATIAAAQFVVCDPTLRPTAAVPIEVRNTCSRGGPAPVRLGLRPHVKSQLLR